MEIYRSDEEQEEALRRWWEENGKMALLGLVLLLCAVVGWQQWDSYQQRQAEAASFHYSEMERLIEQDSAAALELGRTIIGNFSGSHYALLASLLMARAEVENGDLSAAETHLQWVLNQKEDAVFTHLATVRLARILLAQQRGDEALLLIDATTPPPPFQGLYEEVRGDIYLAKGERDPARLAFNRALQHLADEPGKKSHIQMKLDELAPVAIATP
ncbi:MAG: tetratricopeptide repeat protein [Gammaproteobacteria bacterium]|nr:tetratricopeptide repeat protein [Gammaproteobacteria bacterium]